MDEDTANVYAGNVVRAWNKGDAVLLVGAPGSGKTMIAQRAWQKLPSLTEDESFLVDRIYSATKLTSTSGRAPFRAPHHTVSFPGMYGSERKGRWIPGEVSLASEGVLYLDELPEFPRAITSELGRVFHDQSVTLSHTPYPAKFKLLAGMSPCPCGYYGVQNPALVSGRCRCSPDQITRYGSRVPPIFETVIDLTDGQTFTASTGQEPPARKLRPETEGERLKKFFFPKPAPFKTRGSGGFFGLPSWGPRRRR